MTSREIDLWLTRRLREAGQWAVDMFKEIGPDLLLILAGILLRRSFQASACSCPEPNMQCWPTANGYDLCRLYS